jgi:nucleoside 2-deoxyribosyltransferase
MKIYLTGPLFNTAERLFNVGLATALRALGHEVWLPQENEPRDRTAHKVFVNDVAGIDWAEVVVANMDGPDPDSGTCWECGYAYGKKPVIVFHTDCRAGEAGLAPFNLMLSEAANVVLTPMFEPITDLAQNINRELEKLSSKHTAPPSIKRPAPATKKMQRMLR